jgi:ABC-2 type transport system ATP-binding protein
MQPNVIDATNISRNFGKKNVLQDVSIAIPAGTVYGLVGMNGAGKTTLFRLLLGLLNLHSGSCRILGENPSDQSSSLYRNIGVSLEHNGFYGNLSAQENLYFFGRIKGLSKERVDNYIESTWHNFPIFKSKRPVKTFSRGERVQCGLCRAFLGDPEVLILDEPVAALDVYAYEHFCTLVHTAQKKGAALCISSHQIELIETVCTAAGVLENGKLISISTEKVTVEEWYFKTTPMSASELASLSHILDISLTMHPSGFTATLQSPSGAALSKILAALSQKNIAIEELKPLPKSLRDTISNRTVL